ncbi:MAG TPA: hypothetical protein VF631_05495 [Allosphingosinicella sp.]|jgi:hypothetical protein|uniref:hypothetical protein n=1 Tax=Allosphingosinicella sp. TaxID=2823234 RepID=UPI002F281AC8
MSPPVPTDSDDPRHVAHVFGDSFARTIPDPDAAVLELLCEQLDSTTVEDWQMLFARTYAAPRGAA